MGDGSISVLGIGSSSVVATISVGTSPGLVGIIPSLNRAYVGDLGKDNIHVINTTTMDVVVSITISRASGGVDVDVTNGTVLVLDLGNGSPTTNMHVIDVSSNTETADIIIGSDLSDISIDPAANRAYVTDFDEGLKVIDLANNSVLQTIPVANGPHGLAIDSNENLVYVTQVASNTLSVIDVVTGSILDVIPVGAVPQWVALNSSRTKAYVTNEGDGTVSVADKSTRAVIGNITVGTNPFFILTDPSAEGAYVSNVGGNTISVIDTASDIVVSTISVGL